MVSYGPRVYVGDTFGALVGVDLLLVSSAGRGTGTDRGAGPARRLSLQMWMHFS